MQQAEAWSDAAQRLLDEILLERLGEPGVLEAMKSFDELYRQPSDASPLSEVVERLAAAAPKDIADIDLRRYRALQHPWSDWQHTAARGRHWAKIIARVVLEGQK